MKRFHFRLNSVLLLRKRALNAAQEEYSKAIAQRRKIDEVIEEGKEQIAAMNDAIKASWGGRPVVAGQQESLMLGLKLAKTKLDEWKLSRVQALQEEMKKRELYIEANKNFELLEKLKERQKNEHLYAEMQKEQILADDLFNARRASMQITEMA
ncbi:MAG: hypothetical protein MI748_14660 [Opitutales bacterium]|nr:hypothetical protein [Opitutales bacterium]